MKNKVNVLHIIDKYSFGGVETITFSLIDNFKSDRYQLKFIFLRDLGKFEQISRSNVLVKNYSKYSFFQPLNEIINYVKKNDINVIHTHQRKGFYLSFFCSIFFPEIKFIHHEHGDIFPKNIIYNIVMNLFSRRIDLIIAVSKSAKKCLLKKTMLNCDKIKVLYNFVDFNKFNSQKITKSILKEKEKLGIEKDEFVIGFIGRLRKIKGCEYLIRALPYLNLKYKCLIVGDGDLRNELETLSEHCNVSSNVMFVGYQKDIVKYYSLLDILIMPSLSEAGPMAFYEAQAIGIPIIGSDVSAINEFVISEKNGFLFEVKNSYDLANKINSIGNNNNLRKQMEDYSLDNISKYSLVNYIKNLKQIYSGII